MLQFSKASSRSPSQHSSSASSVGIVAVRGQEEAAADSCPTGFVRPVAWGNQCRTCFRSLEEHQLEDTVAKMYDSIERKKQYWDQVAREEAERRRFELTTRTRTQQQSPLRQGFSPEPQRAAANGNIFHFRSSKDADAAARMRITSPPPATSSAVSSPRLQRRNTATPNTRIPVPIHRLPQYQSCPTSPVGSRRGSLTSTQSPGSSRSGTPNRINNGHVKKDLTTIEPSPKIILENPFKPKPRYDSGSLPRHFSLKNTLTVSNGASKTIIRQSPSAPCTRSSSPVRKGGEAPWRGTIKNFEFGGAKKKALPVNKKVTEPSKPVGGYSCMCLDRRELKKAGGTSGGSSSCSYAIRGRNMKELLSPSGGPDEQKAETPREPLLVQKAERSLEAKKRWLADEEDRRPSLSSHERQMSRTTVERSGGDAPQQLSDLSLAEKPYPAAPRSHFSVNSLPRNFVLPPLEEEDGAVGGAGLHHDQVQRPLAAPAFSRRPQNDSEASGGAAGGTSVRSKSPVPSLTTLDSGLHLSERDPMEPEPDSPMERVLRGATRDQLEGMLECVNRRSIPSRNEENPLIPLERIRRQSVNEDKEVIQRQAVIVEGLKLETEELQERIARLEHDLDTSSDRNQELSEAMEKRSVEMEDKLAEAKASCFKASEENEDLRRTVKDMETLIDEVQDHFRESDAKEWRKLKTEVRKLSHSCRNFQLKLRRATQKANDLKIANKEMAQKLKRSKAEDESRSGANGLIFFGSALAVTGLFVWSRLTH